MRKLSIFGLIVLVLLLLPRITNISLASDCFWVWQNNQYTCQQYNTTQAPQYYTQHANTTKQNPWGQIWQQGPLTRINNQCLYSTAIGWQTAGTSQVQVTVMDPDNGQEKLFAGAVNGQMNAPWISPNKSYRFSLWDLDNGQKTILGSLYISGWGLNCGVPDNGQYYPANPSTAYPGTGSNNPGYGNAHTGTIALTSDQAYCVGQITNYTVSAPGFANQSGQWTSWHDNQHNGQISIALDGSGNFYGTSKVWGFGDMGHWKKLVQFNNATQTLEFDVRDCGDYGQNNTSNSNNSVSPSYQNSNYSNSTYTDSSYPANDYQDQYGNWQQIQNNYSTGNNYNQ